MPKRPEYLKPFAAIKPLKPASQIERERFYGGVRWQRCRVAYLNEHPLCAHCQRQGRQTEAKLVHHVVERLDDPELAFDWDNLIGLCSACHNRVHKTKR